MTHVGEEFAFGVARCFRHTLGAPEHLQFRNELRPVFVRVGVVHNNEVGIDNFLVLL